MKHELSWPDLFDDQFTKQWTSHHSAVIKNAMWWTVSYQYVRLAWYQHPVLAELRECCSERSRSWPTFAWPRRPIDMQTLHKNRLILEINGVLQTCSDLINGFTRQAHLVTASHKYLQHIHACFSHWHSFSIAFLPQVKWSPQKISLNMSHT